MQQPLETTSVTLLSNNGGSKLDVVGLHGGECFGPLARQALAAADVVVGAQRLHDDLDRVNQVALSAERIKLFGPLDKVLDLIEERVGQGQRVCMVASGDPGFFGIERLLVGRFGTAVAVHPAPSSIALAFARAQIHWDDATIVSCHGRPLARALPHILGASKVAVLVSNTTPPQAVGAALLDAGAPHRHAVVVSRIGEADESLTRTDIAGLADGTFDPLSVLILTAEQQPIAVNAIVGWGRPIAEYEHRASMITKPEVRAVVLSKLELFGAGVLWDVGACSGSVGIEAARLAPGLRVYAIEQNSNDCERIRSNANRVALTVIEQAAPEAYQDLPDPDRVFVGGGGITSFVAACDRLRSGGTVVATYATMQSALEALQHLGASGQLVQMSTNRGVPVGPKATLRLQADNPVFIVWGTPE